MRWNCHSDDWSLHNERKSQTWHNFLTTPQFAHVEIYANFHNTSNQLFSPSPRPQHIAGSWRLHARRVWAATFFFFLFLNVLTGTRRAFKAAKNRERQKFNFTPQSIWKKHIRTFPLPRRVSAHNSTIVGRHLPENGKLWNCLLV